MAEYDYTIMGSLIFWSREKCYHQMLAVAEEALKKYPNDVILQFFIAIAYLFKGKVQESLRRLDPLINKQDINLAAVLAMIHGHKQAKNIEKEAVQMLEIKLKTERKIVNPKAYYFAGLFSVLMGKYDKAKEYSDRANKNNMMDKTKELLALKGWIDMANENENTSKNAIEFFNKSLSQEGLKHPEATFGKVAYNMKHSQFINDSLNDSLPSKETTPLYKKKFQTNIAQQSLGGIDLNNAIFQESMELINQCIVSYQNFLPGLVQKMYLYFAIKDWDTSVEMANRILLTYPNCLQAKELLILNHLVNEGNCNEAHMLIGDLLSSINLIEPQSAYFFDYYSKLFSKLCSRNQIILSKTISMEEKALTLDSDNVFYQTELGKQLLMLNKIKEASKCFSIAIKLDESRYEALAGILKCHLMENQLKEANNHIEFLQELHDVLDSSPEIIYLYSLLWIKQEEPFEKIINMLKKCIDMHLDQFKNNNSFDTDYLLKLNPAFVIEIVQALMTYVPQQPLSKGQIPNVALSKCCYLLELLVKAVPGHLDACFLMAKTKFLMGDLDYSGNLLQFCLENDSTSSEYHILMAQVHLYSNNFKMANQSLDVGLSHNFQVREHPIYHLIKAQILKKQGDLKETLKTLQTAYNLPGVRQSSMTNKIQKNSVQINLIDRVSVFIELADVHRLLNQTHEASKIMQDAINDFKGTSEEVRITVANVDLALSRGEIEDALTMLSNIEPDQVYYIEAKQKMALIYLEYKKDKKLYSACYQEMYNKLSTPQTGILLGDAYMNIHEPDKAIEVYEAAIKKNPKDAVLAKKIGQALVKTHQYGRAIIYYEASLKYDDHQNLRYDLAELLLLLKMEDKAEKILKQFLEKGQKSNDLEVMIQFARCSLIMSEVCDKKRNYDDKLNYLKKAKETQDRILMRANLDQPESMNENKLFAAKICWMLGKHYAVLMRNYTGAIDLYREALKHSHSDGKIVLELSKLLCITGDLDESEKLCKDLINTNNEKKYDAIVMLAEILFKRNDFDNAALQIENLLKEKPDHYEGLVRVVEMFRRAGKLEECPIYLDMAQNASQRSEYDAGFNFCKGLFLWYTGDVEGALSYLNRCRKDGEFGRRATFTMVELCLNPDNQTLGGSVFKHSHDESNDKREVERIALETADKLLKDLRPEPGDLRHTILANILKIITKNTTYIEAGLNNLLELCKIDPDNVAVLYGSAIGFIMINQPAKARSQLKRISRTAWNVEDAEYLEKSWLLLADIYIQKEVYDIANEMLKRCLDYNKSCCKAYEYMGYLMERNQSYYEAAEHYQSAWKFENRKNPAIGFKLAFNYLKSKRFTDAIDVCHQVLLSYPDYPKIRKEILDKARSLIKTPL